MQVIVFLFGLLIVQSTQHITLEECNVDMAAAVDKYLKHVQAEKERKQASAEVPREHILYEIDLFNELVKDGPIQCYYFLIEDTKDFIRVALKECDAQSKALPPLEPAALQRFPKDYMYTVDENTRDYYCRYYIEYVNDYWDFLEAEIERYKNCDVNEVMAELRWKQWNECRSTSIMK